MNDIDNWDQAIEQVNDPVAHEYLQHRASGVSQGGSLAKVDAGSNQLLAWRQNAAFRAIEAALATANHNLTPELAKRRLKIKSLLIANQVIDDALNAKRASDRTNAASLAFRAAGVVTPEGAGVNADLASATRAMVELMGKWSESRNGRNGPPVIDGTVIEKQGEQA